MSSLFSPIKLGQVELANRIVVAPDVPVQRRRRQRDRLAMAHLGMLANCGAGLVIVEATHVERHGRITHGCMGLYSDHNEAALQRVIDHCRLRRHGQMGHPDRACRAQGVVAAALGGRRAAEGRPGPVGDARAVAAAVRQGLAHAARRRRWPTSPMSATASSIRPSARCGSASTRSSCTTPTAIWRIRSSRRCRTTAPTSTAARWRTACGSAARSRVRCARWCRSRSRSARASPAATGAMTGFRPTTRWPIARR